MKKLTSSALGVSLFIVLLTFSACKDSQNIFKPGAEEVALDPLTENVLQVGQVAYLKLDEHGSTGLESAAINESPDVMETLNPEFYYDNPDKDMAPGGDAGFSVYKFKALKAGEATIKTQRIWRGEVDEEVLVKIVVK